MKKIFLLVACIISSTAPSFVHASSRIADFKAHPPIHIFRTNQDTPTGITPAQIKKIYHLPETGGSGTIAIIAAFDDPAIERDLGVFDAQFSLAPCTTQNGCFEKHKIDSSVKANSGWSFETSLDVEWSHAIAPDAKILLVEATAARGPALLQAVDYARSRPDVVAISMSWGGAEFPGEVELDSHFTSDSDVTFFASSGDHGTGVNWPAASPHIVAVGGTTIVMNPDGSLGSEQAWSGSGGGVSAYEKQPSFQSDYSIKKAHAMRAVPDVAYNADPASGFAVFKSSGKTTKRGWHVLGGTSAGAPQWAAIKALGLSASNEKFYHDKAQSNNASYFRDITKGSNGDCTYYCDARKRYDYITGLGTPLTVHF